MPCCGVKKAAVFWAFAAVELRSITPIFASALSAVLALVLSANVVHRARIVPSPASGLLTKRNWSLVPPMSVPLASMLIGEPIVCAPAMPGAPMSAPVHAAFIAVVVRKLTLENCAATLSK